MKTIVTCILLFSVVSSITSGAEEAVPQKPVIVGNWKRIMTMPDLDELAGPQAGRQHIVDHGLVQDAAGNWRLWACLRGTAVSRLLYGWKSPELFVESWEPLGVVARAQRRFGERVKESGEETIGAPFFLKEGDTWYCFYHSGGIRLMTSTDGVTFERAADWGPDGNLAGIPGGRDVTIMKHDGTFYSYATVTTPDGKRGYIVAATSTDLKQWKNRGIVCEAPAGENGPVSAESPFVLFKDGFFYLWRSSSHDFKSYIYRSSDPLNFDPGSDDKLIDTVRLKAPEVVQQDDRWFITDLHDFQGLRMSELTWEVDESAEREGPAEEVGELSIPEVSPLNVRQLETMRQLVEEHPEAAALAAEARRDALPLLNLQPQPLKEIHYEGLVNTDPRRIASVAGLNDMADVARLLRYWQVSGDPHTVETIKRYILAWSGTYEITGNDVNENKFHPLLSAYYSLREEFSKAQRDDVDAWVAELGEQHAGAVRGSQHFTNRYTKHIRLTAVCGMILDRDEWIELAFDGIRRFVTESLYPDGTSEDLKRRDALGYHVSGLRPPLELAMLLGERGSDLYAWQSPKGGSLKNSVDYVVPYAMGKQVHQEWVNTKVGLDKRRAAAGIEKYQPGKEFDPRDSLKLMETAAYFDPKLMNVVRHLSEDDAEQFPTWQTLVNATAASQKADQP